MTAAIQRMTHHSRGHQSLDSRSALTTPPSSGHHRLVFERRRQPSESQRTGTRVLIVDDDFLVAEVFAHTVRGLGYQVAGMAGNGNDGLKMVVDLEPDVVLMDVRMPGIDGIETSRRIQEKRPTPIVLLSAYDTYELTEKAIDAGVGAYLRKPPDRLALDRAIGIAKARFADLLRLRTANERLRSQRAFAEQMLNQQHTLTDLLALSLNTSTLVFREEEALRILTSMAGFPPTKEAAILHYDATSKNLIRRAVIPTTTDILKSDIEQFSLSHSLYAQAVATKEMAFISQTGGRSLRCCSNESAHAHYAIPLLAETKLVGILALDIDLTLPDLPPPDTIFLKTVGGIITGLIKQSNLQDLTEHNATHDALTQLPNRLLLFSLAEKLLARAKRLNCSVAVLFIDLDGFKAINDRLGHDAGDRILKNAAEKIRESIRACDCVGRLGGDEFVAVLGDISKLETANEIADRIIEAISQTEKGINLSASIGVAIYPRNTDHFDELLRMADQAMYKAKAMGTGEICFAITPHLDD
jgi:diguanylate cyclase (GGDEF)-like protein